MIVCGLSVLEWHPGYFPAREDRRARDWITIFSHTHRGLIGPRPNWFTMPRGKNQRFDPFVCPKLKTFYGPVYALRIAALSNHEIVLADPHSVVAGQMSPPATRTIGPWNVTYSV